MKKVISYMAGALMLLIPAMAGAQALPFTAVDTNPVTLAKGSAGLTETTSFSHSAFTNAAAIPFAESSFDVSAGYTMWQPSSVQSNVISVAGAYNLNNKLGIAAGVYYGMNQAIAGYKPSDMHAALGVSYRFLDFLSVGVNFGYANQKLTAKNSYGAVALDAFVMAKFADFKVTAGVANGLGRVTGADRKEYCIPGSIALGAGYDKAFAEKHAIEANVDVDYFFSGALAAAVGAGYTFNDLVSVRAGYRYGGESVIPSYASVGLGVKFAGIKLDLAYLAGDAMSNTIALGLGYSF